MEDNKSHQKWFKCNAKRYNTARHILYSSSRAKEVSPCSDQCFNSLLMSTVVTGDLPVTTESLRHKKEKRLSVTNVTRDYLQGLS